MTCFKLPNNVIKRWMLFPSQVPFLIKKSPQTPFMVLVLSRNCHTLKDALLILLSRGEIMTENWIGLRKTHAWMYLWKNLEKGSTGGWGWNSPEMQVTLLHRPRDPKENRRRKGRAKSLHSPLALVAMLCTALLCHPSSP